MRCTCGRWLTAASARGRGNSPYRYYQCTDRDTCRGRIKADSLESQVFQTLRNLPIRPVVIEEAMRLFQTRLTDEMAAHTDADEQKRLQSDRRELESTRVRLVDLFANGLVNSANAIDIHARLADVRGRIETSDRRLPMLHTLASPDPAAIADATAWARTFRDLGAAVESMQTERDAACAILRAVIERIDLLQDGESESAEGARPEPRWRMTLRLPGSSNAIEWLPRWACVITIPAVA